MTTIELREVEANLARLVDRRPETEWPRDAGGRLQMHTRRLDLADLRAARA